MEPAPSSSTGHQHPDLAADVRELKSFLYVALAALVVMGVGLNLYLGKQMRLARGQFYMQQKSAEDSERLVRNFAVAMNGFASTNKDFQPIFDKYRGVFSKYIGGPGAPPPNP